MTADELVFFVNGKKVVEKNADPETTLLAYLRRKLGLSGTKLGCGEGGCGACTVMLSKYDRFQNKIVHFSANACLAPICSLHHVAVTTVEGIGSTKSRLHPVQERIAKSHGSQCGFCTPGIVMSMYTLLRNQPEPTIEEIEDAFQGNLCRCTGYRPILQGFRTFARDGGCCGGSGNDLNCCMNQKTDHKITLSPSLFNPEEFTPLDPTQEPIFPPELLRLKDTPQKQLRFEGERVTWIQASTLQELLDLKAQDPEAKLVVGNTEIGIEMKFKNMLFPKMVCPAWIPELNSVEHGPEGISFGASCPLSFVEKTLLDAVANLPAHQTEVFKGVLEQLRWFAGKQVKSVASIGGNIITASPISDLNPVFMASGAKLTIVSTGTRRTVRMDHTFFPAYRKTLLAPEEILLSIEIPYSREGEYFSAFKQASRREDDIAKVTSGMRVLFNPGTAQVKELALCYGGMHDRTVSALKTTRKQISNFWNEELLQNVCAGLAEELSLAPDAPGGMVEFRRTLTLSFFFKFYLTVLQKLGIQNSKDKCGKLDPTHASATLLFQKDPPANVQLFQEVPKGQCEEDMVGRPLPHLAAAMQASGEAVYCDDIPRYENELSLRLVTSTRAHAKIKSIDTSEAQKVPGFVCFISAADVPGSNITGIGNDEMVFAKDKVTCIGHIIGAVVTDTREHAQRAAQAVRITYEDLPAIITIEDAIAKDSFYEPELKIEKGNLTKGFSEADNIVSGELYIGGQEHFYLETHCTIAVPKGEAGEMELFVSTQNTTKTQSFVANMLGVPANRIVVRVKRMGGGFGGKETRSTVVSTAVALAAYKTGRPVRCMLDRDEDMLITGGRHPFLARYKVGFMKTGRVVALKVEHYSNAGNTLDLSQSIMERALFHMDNCYNIPNIQGTGRICKTNLPSNTAFRGFGGPQGMFIAEHWMSEVAVTCGLPAEEVRRKNMYKEGDLTHFNQKLEGFTLPRCWEECLASSQYHARKREVDKFNEENCWKKRGLSIIPTKFGISFTVPFLNQAGALVHVYTDGSVLLTHGGTEMGQGLHTKMVQVASRTLKIPTSKIYISETSTNTVPNTSPTAASVSTDINGQAVYEACQTILKRLEPFKKKNPSGSWEDWVTAAYLDAVSLSATGFYKTPNLGYSFETNSGNPFHYFSYGVACSEVEIDCLTGDHKNLRTDIVMDVGSSLNPAIDIGQVEGAFVQGLGLFTLEELHYSPEGSLHTRGPSTYKIPAFGSIPSEFRVSLLRDCPNKKAIYASKAVGEPPLFLAASIFFAIKDAIRAARAGNPDCKTKKLFQLNSPATPEKIRNACVDQFTKLVVEKNADPETTLLAYLRRKLGLSGTKLGCGEGGCGACTVMLSKYDRFQNKIVHFSANACLAPICSLHHVAVTTVEGIGSTKSRLHPVQERIAKSHGSQCGFCTPGIVMSMYTLLRNQPEPTIEEIEDAFQGNLCRCTGYRPILQGFRTFARDGGCCGGSGNDLNCCMNQKTDHKITLSPSLFNPEEFTPLDPTQEPIFPPELLRLKDTPQKQLRFEGERVTWIQASTLQELLDLKAQDPEAKLVVGNTEIGIEMKFKNMLFPKMVCPAWIPELNSVEYGPEGISFGASCPLSFVEKTLLDAVANLPAHQTEVFKGVLEQLRWFAGKQVKSVASIGGNVITASPISDLNPVFMASGAKLTIVSTGTRRTVRMDHTFFPAYRKTLLAPEEILLSIEIPYSREGEYFSAFKQASRREDDIAKVTSGMRVLFNPGTAQVKELALCYGGMHDRTVSALKTMRKQISNFWNEELLQNVCAGLAEELSLAPDAPGGMVEFRRTLTLSFFFKFYLTVLQKLGIQNSKDKCGKLDPTHASATLLFQKDPPANVQLFQEVPKGQCEEDMVGRPLPHLAAAMQASGEAVYCDDIPRYENELSLRLVTSTRAHAKIKSIDTSEAQKVPGFVCFISAADVPGSNITGIGNDEMVFAKDKVTCIGHVIGAVVTDTREHAQRAAQAVRITYEDLPAIITIEDAIAKDSFYEPELKIEKGNLTKGFSEADNIVSGELYIGGQEHFYLETHCTIAVPKGEAGEMELFVSTQNTTKTQSFVANMLGVPANRVLVRVKRMGGGFGGKDTRSSLVSTAVALAAYKTGRPVRCMLDRDEDMLITGGRHPFLARYKVGFMKTGRVVALKVEHYSNAGNTLDLSQSIMERALFHMDNSYNVPNIQGTGRICKTNLPSNTAFRGFGGPQAMLIAEYWMSEVAVTCGLPAEEVRRKNMYKEGDLTHFNQKLEGFNLFRCWDECLASSQYHARKREVDKFNEENCWKKRGLSIIPTKYGVSFALPFLNQAGALVHVYTDGSVLLTHGGTEMGQGLHTKMVQVASRALKIPTSKIYISETSTNTVPNTSPTAASVSTDLNGQAVYEACQTILKRLEPFKKKNPSGSWEDWVTAAYLDAVSLSATGFYKTPNIGYSFETNSGNPFHYFSYGVACSEVEIDCLTGDHKNLRTDIVMDVGSSLNPAIDIGQVEGAFVQGLGLFTLEELHYSPEGSLHTRGPSTYKIPAFGSIPSEFRVSLLRDCPNKKAIYASKAVGEPPLFLAASIFFAIKDAIRAARAGNPDCKTKKLFQLNSPATPEKIRNACVDQFTKLV